MTSSPKWHYSKTFKATFVQWLQFTKLVANNDIKELHHLRTEKQWQELADAEMNFFRKELSRTTAATNQT